MSVVLKKDRLGVRESASQNTKYDYLGPVENYTQGAVPRVKVYLPAPLHSFSAIHVMTEVIAFLSQYISEMVECTELTPESAQKWNMEEGKEKGTQAYTEVILIRQPAHINTRKSTHLKTWEANLSHNSVLECRAMKNWSAHKFPFFVFCTNAR